MCFDRRSSEGPPLLKTFGEEEQGDSEDENQDGDGGAEGPVVSGAKEALDDVGDHDAGGAANELRREEIAEGENKSERCASQQAGEREGKDDAEERCARSGTEIVGSFDEIARNMFEGSVERKKDEGRIDVREHENYGEGAVEEKADGFVSDV